MNLRDTSSHRLSFLICTYNSQTHIAEVLDSIIAQNYPPEKTEIIIIDDNSSDQTLKIINKYQNGKYKIKVISKKKHHLRGAALSSNLGIKIAKGDLLCFVDSDAVLTKNWIKNVLPKFNNPEVGIVAGVIRTANPENLWASFAGKELEDRYDRLTNHEVGHVSTCNTVYRKEVFEKVGLLNEKLYYGYDVDISYRARSEGYRILVLKSIFCRHYWKDSLKGYLRQIYNTGYYRLQILGKYPDVNVGGKISGLKLVFQVPAIFVLFLLLIIVPFNNRFWPICVFILILILFAQIPITVRIVKKTRDKRLMILPVVLLVRNIVWFIAVIKYCLEVIKAKRLSK